MQYQLVIKKPFCQKLRVKLPPKPRCIKGTFILCYFYQKRESKNDNGIKKKSVKTGRNARE